MEPSFKISIPITKSYTKKNGKVGIEGIASDPTIDREEEKFDIDAVKKMLDGVNKGGIPIRVEHEEKVYSDVGFWKEAMLQDDGRLYVKGELDTELSLGKDIAVLLKRGTEIGLSVGGAVLDAVYEYSKELGRSIKVYKDVILSEISVVKHPANSSTNLSLSIAKSVDWDKLAQVEKEGIEARGIPYTTKAQQIIDYHKGIKVEKSTSSSKPKKAGSYKKWLEEVEPQVDGIMKDCYYDDCCEAPYMLTAEDLMLVTQIMTVMTNVELPGSDEYPDILMNDSYWENLVEEQQIVLWCREIVMPHHNTDLSLNKELVLYQMKKLIDFRGYYTHKDYNVIMAHLFRHLKDLELIKKGRQPKKENVVEKHLSSEELAMLKGAYQYKKGLTQGRPTGMDTKAIEECALAYESLLNSSYISN